MKKIITVAIVTLTLSACEPIPVPVYQNDQELRTEIFMKCLSVVPAGPLATKYNDWNEVVDSCEDAAYRQSKRCVKNCDKSVITISKE